MTALLEKAIQRASKLPDQEQEAIGALILEEISAESRWDAQFSGSPDKLLRLADGALTEFKTGRTKTFAKDSELAHD
jgi:hypothetical protein